MSNEARALLQSTAGNTTSWANMADEENAKKAKAYLPGASKWAANQATIAEEASAERAQTPNSLSESNLEDIRKTMYAYDKYTDRMGLPRRASRTPTPERRRRNYERRRTARRQSPRRQSARRQSPRRQSPRRRSPSPVRRYGVGRRYVAAPGFGTRDGRRSPSPRRRSPSPRRRSPSPRYSRRRSPSPRYSRRRSPSPRRRGSRNASPLRYTVTNNGRTVNEFGRNVPARGTAQGPRFNTRRQRRPVHVFDEKTKTYKPANWNI